MTKVQEVLLAYRVDRSSQQAAIGSTKAVRGALEDLSDVNALGALGLSVQNDVDRFNDRVSDLGGSINITRGDVDQLNQSLAEQARQQQVVTDAIEGQTKARNENLKTAKEQAEVPEKGGDGSTSGLNTLNRFGGIGSQIAGGVGASSTIGNAVGLVGDLAGAFATANPLLIAGAVAAGGLGLVFGEVARRADEAKAAAQKFSDELQRQAGLAASGITSADLNEQNASLLVEQSFYDERGNQLRAIAAVYDDLDRQFYDAQGRIGQTIGAESQAYVDESRRIDAEKSRVLAVATQITGGAIESFDALMQGIANADTEYGRVDALLAGNIQLMGTAAVAFNDQNVAVETLIGTNENFEQQRQQQNDKLLADIANQVSEQTRYQGLLEGNNAAALEAEQQRLFLLERTQQAQIKAATESGFLTSELDALRVELRGTGEQIDEVTGALTRLNKSEQARQQIAEAIQKRTEALKVTKAASDKAADALTAVRDAQADSAARFEDINAALLDKLSEADEKASADRLRINTGATKDALKVESEFQKNRLKIERDASRSIAQAIGDRDVLGAITAQQQRDDALADAKQANDERVAAQREGVADQLREITTGLDKQKAVIRKDRDDKIRQEQSRAAQELAVRQTALQRANDDLQRALVAQRGLNVAGYAATTTVVQGAFNGFVNIANSAAAGIARAGQLLSGGSASNASNLGAGLGNLFANITTPASGRQTSTVNNIVINTATNTRQVTALSNQEARRVLERVITEY